MHLVSFSSFESVAYRRCTMAAVSIGDGNPLAALSPDYNHVTMLLPLALPCVMCCLPAATPKVSADIRLAARQTARHPWDSYIARWFVASGKK